MGLAYIELMKLDPYYLSQEKKMEVVSEYVFVAGQMLREAEKKEPQFLQKEVEEKLDPNMIVSLLLSNYFSHPFSKTVLPYFAR